MLKSDTTQELFTAFSKFQGEVNAVLMDNEVKVTTKTGGTYTFEYATLTNLVETAKPHLKENGLAVTQLLDGSDLTTVLTHESGEFIGSTTSWTFKPEDPQKAGSLITYMRRYAYAAILGLVSDEDDDANTASGNSIQKGTDFFDEKANARSKDREYTTQGKAIDESMKGADDCPINHEELAVLTVKKEGKNKGRQFKSCTREECGFFEWVDNNTQPQEMQEESKEEIPF